MNELPPYYGLLQQGKEWEDEHLKKLRERIRIEEELNNNKLYRKLKVNYSDFANDLV